MSVSEEQFRAAYNVTDDEMAAFRLWAFHQWYGHLRRHEPVASNDEVFMRALELSNSDIAEPELAYQQITTHFRGRDLDAVLAEMLPERMARWDARSAELKAMRPGAWKVAAVDEENQ